MDNTLFSELSYLRNHWIERVLEDYEQERDELGPSGIKLLQKESRSAVWNMCKLLGVDMNGVPGRTCRLLERYLHKYITIYCSHIDDDEERGNFKRELFARIPLLTASCAQLSAKMSSGSTKVNANHVRACLRILKLEYSIQEINTNAFHVFKILGFRVPLWTGVEEGQMFALEIGMPRNMLEGVAVIVNSAEFARDRIEQCVRGIANDSPGSSEGRPLQSLHLVVGAVVASARYLAFSEADPAPRLANLTSAPPSFISCIADVILKEILVDSSSSEDGSQPKKRKVTHINT